MNVDLYLWIKWLHIVSSTILLGTGAGIAFFFVRAQRHRSGGAASVRHGACGYMVGMNSMALSDRICGLEIAGGTT
jgi:uncharacterized membrane protein